MVTKCANPACSALFRYLHGGRLYRLEVEGRDEYFWLCSDCASTMVLKVVKGDVVTAPRQAAKLPEMPLARSASSGDATSHSMTDAFVAVDCGNDLCRRPIFLMRAGERHSSH